MTAGPRYGMVTKAEMVDRLAALRELHERNPRFPYYCRHCRAPWPCATLRILDGGA